VRGKTASLIIGVTGFVGRNLANFIRMKGESVVGTYVSHKPSKKHFDAKIHLVRCDVTNQRSVETLIRRFSPASIYYLAAQSSVREAWLSPVKTIQINFLGAVYLLEVLRRSRLKSNVLIFSSATTYGRSYQTGKPLTENACLNPKDPYSVSKAGIDFFARLYATTCGMHVTVVRLANLTGPGQTTIFSISNFASQIARIEAGLQPPLLEVGDLSAVRDYLDIRDGIRALYLAMKFGKPGEAYNIASERSRSLRTVLEELIQLSKISKNQIKIRRKEALIPKDEISAIRLNCSKFQRLTGWRPQILFHQTLRDVLNEWRTQIGTKTKQR